MSAMTVWVVLPSKPEHFAYGPYLTLEAALNDYEFRRGGGPGVIDPRRKEVGRIFNLGRTAVILRLDDIPTWTHAGLGGLWNECWEAGNLVHEDGTKWTQEDWERRHPYLDEVNRRIWPRRLSSI